MPWELEIRKYDGQIPRKRSEADSNRFLPLGAVEEVRLHLSKVLPTLEWEEEPPLLEILKASGSDLWKDWDEELLTSASRPKLKAYYESENLSIEFYGFDQPGELQYLLLDVRGEGNPLPLLKKICQPLCWSIADFRRDAEFINLDQTDSPRWRNWLGFLKRATETDATDDDQI